MPTDMLNHLALIANPLAPWQLAPAGYMTPRVRRSGTVGDGVVGAGHESMFMASTGFAGDMGAYRSFSGGRNR